MFKACCCQPGRVKLELHPRQVAAVTKDDGKGFDLGRLQVWLVITVY